MGFPIRFYSTLSPSKLNYEYKHFVEFKMSLFKFIKTFRTMLLSKRFNALFSCIVVNNIYFAGHCLPL